MKKVKIIEKHNKSLKEFEGEINDFIRHKDVEDINYQSYLIPYEGTEHTVMITYNVKEEKM